MKNISIFYGVWPYRLIFKLSEQSTCNFAWFPVIMLLLYLGRIKFRLGGFRNGKLIEKHFLEVSKMLKNVFLNEMSWFFEILTFVYIYEYMSIQYVIISYDNIWQYTKMNQM